MMFWTSLLTTGCIFASVFYPKESDQPLHNPLMGWCIIDHALPTEIDAGKSVAQVQDGTPYEWYPNAAVLSTWAQVERQPDQYDWSLMDQSITYWANTGKNIHIRFSTEDFGGFRGCPEWIYDMGVPRQKQADGTLFPDYSHAVYQERLQKFMAEFARHFCKDPRIETIDLRAYGNWGEWHSGYGYPSCEMRVKALHSLIDHWREATGGRKFLNLSVSYEWRTHGNSGDEPLPVDLSIYGFFKPTYREYVHNSAFDYALAFPDIAIRRDGVGGAVFQEYDGRLMAEFFAQYYKPLSMEFFGGIENFTAPSVVGFPGTKPGDNFVGNAVDEALSHHPNYINAMGWGAFGGATRFYNEYHSLILKAHNLMGYRFVPIRLSFPDTVVPGGILSLSQRWENRALGRCYKQFPLEASLLRDGKTVWRGVDATFDQRNMVAGETYAVESYFSLPSDLTPGEYELRIAMVDEKGQPSILFAVEGMDSEKRLPIGHIQVQPPKEQYVATTNANGIEPILEQVRWRYPETLKTNCEYEVSFRYKVVKTTGHLGDDALEYWRCYADTSTGRRIGENRWYDQCGQPSARKTVLISTEDGGEATLYWDAPCGGSIEIGDVHITPLSPNQVYRIPVPGEGVILENGATLFQNDRVRIERDRSQVVLPDDWIRFLHTNPTKVKLAPNTVYTVWFYCAMRPQIWQGDYVYMAVRSVHGDKEAEISMNRWTQRHTSAPVYRSYSFRTGPFEDYQVEWGIKNGGCCEISKIVLVRYTD